MKRGPLEVQAGGLEISGGGLTISDGGLIISDGGATVSSGGLYVTDDVLSVASDDTGAPLTTLRATSTAFDDAVLELRADTAMGQGFSLLRVRNSAGVALGDWLGDGQLRLRQGGLQVDADGIDVLAGGITASTSTIEGSTVVGATGGLRATAGGLTVVAGGGTIQDGGLVSLASADATLALDVRHTSTAQSTGDGVLRVRGESDTTSDYTLLSVQAKDTGGGSTYTERLSVAGSGATTVTGTLVLPTGSYLDGQVGDDGDPAPAYIGALRGRLAHRDAASDNDGTIVNLSHDECGSIVSLGNSGSTAGFATAQSVVRLPEVTASTSKHGCEVTIVLQGTGCLPPACDIGIRQSLANSGNPTVLYGHFLDHGGPGDTNAPTFETLYVTTFGALAPNYQVSPTSSAFAGQWIKLGSYPGASTQWVVLGGNGKWDTNLI